MEEKELLQAIGQIVQDKLVPINGRLDNIDGRLDIIDGRLDTIDGRLGNIELVIENELRPNIQKLAEGYEPYYKKTCVNNIKLKDLEERFDILEISTKQIQMR